jgi:microcystin-dependent protein
MILYLDENSTRFFSDEDFMSQPYVGQVICVGFNFAPVGWLPCDGRLLPISQYDVLYNLIGTTYGGDGVNTFGLPDLRGRTPLGSGQLSGGGSYVAGQTGGAETVSLTGNQYPSHSHGVVPTQNNGNSNSPGNNFLAAGQQIYNGNAPTAAMNSQAVTPSGGNGLPHSNLQPYLTCNWIISLYGVYPTQG